MRLRWKGFIIGAVILGAASLALTNKNSKGQLAAAEKSQETASPGWSVLNGLYNSANLVDGFTFEWQYFMVHDAEGQFSGSIGYVLVDPRGRLGRVSQPAEDSVPETSPDRFSIMPSGASVAIAGTWGDRSTFSNYERFAEHYAVGVQDKNFRADSRNGEHFAELAEVEKISAQGGVFRLTGKTEDVEYDLQVTPDWIDNNSDQHDQPFGPLTGRDIGFLPGEQWTVQMQWPRTQVEGQMTNRKTGKTYTISGHGYRENSWGRWNFAVDGWAFSVLSDPKAQVQWTWQSYHKSKDMDWVDVAFVDQGELKKLRFFAKNDQLRWKLSAWSFHTEARQCVPHAVEVVAQNQDYRIKVSYDLKNSQLPMMSAATPLTKIFVIMIHMPYMKGSIESVKTGEQLASFEGQGGGEFSTTRSVWADLSASDCEEWGQRFNQEYAPSPILQ